MNCLCQNAAIMSIAGHLETQTRLYLIRNAQTPPTPELTVISLWRLYAISHLSFHIYVLQLMLTIPQGSPVKLSFLFNVHGKSTIWISVMIFYQRTLKFFKVDGNVRTEFASIVAIGNPKQPLIVIEDL